MVKDLAALQARCPVMVSSTNQQINEISFPKDPEEFVIVGWGSGESAQYSWIL